MLDGTGFNGTIMSYALMAFFFGGAICFFLFFWWRGLLSFDEEAKIQMMEEDNHKRS